MHFTAINAGPEFKFSEAVSFAVTCKDQEEIDYFWEKLSSDVEFEQCGWRKDKFGLSRQIIPKNMGELMKRPQAFANMMEMKNSSLMNSSHQSGAREHHLYRLLNRLGI